MNLMTNSGIDGDDGDNVKEGFAPGGIDTSSDDFYNINTTNFNQNPQIKSFIPRPPKGKPKPKAAYNKPRCNGPVYLPKYIYDILSEEVKKELEKYNKEKKANYQPNSNRMPKVHEQDHGEEHPAENPERDHDNHYTDDSYPMQDSYTEELIDSHSGYSAKMAFLYISPSTLLLPMGL